MKLHYLTFPKLYMEFLYGIKIICNFTPEIQDLNIY